MAIRLLLQAQTTFRKDGPYFAGKNWTRSPLLSGYHITGVTESSTPGIISLGVPNAGSNWHLDSDPVSTIFGTSIPPSFNICYVVATFIAGKDMACNKEYVRNIYRGVGSSKGLVPRKAG